MRTLLLLGLIASVTVLAGCEGRSSWSDASSSAETAAGTTNPSARVPGDSTGALLPITSAAILARVSDGHARATVVNVWATWCVPCREEFPDLLDVANSHKADGVRLMLVSADFDQQLGDVRTFLKSHGVRDTSYFKRDGDQAFIDALNPKWTGTIPVTFVYDATGKRVAFWEGRANRARFETAIQLALKSTPSATKEIPS